MTIEEALDHSLEEIRYGNASIGDCLKEYPHFANRLRPLLNTAVRLEKTSQVRPGREFKNQLRKQLAEPPRRSRFFSIFSISFALILLLALLVLIWAGINYLSGNYMLDQVLPKLPLLLPVSHYGVRMSSAVIPLWHI